MRVKIDLETATTLFHSYAVIDIIHDHAYHCAYKTNDRDTLNTHIIKFTNKLKGAGKSTEVSYFIDVRGVDHEGNEA